MIVLEQTGKKWSKTSEGTLVERKMQLPTRKLMATFSYRQGDFHVNFFHDRRKINANYNCEMLDVTKFEENESQCR